MGTRKSKSTELLRWWTVIRSTDGYSIQYGDYVKMEDGTFCQRLFEIVPDDKLQASKRGLLYVIQQAIDKGEISPDELQEWLTRATKLQPQKATYGNTRKSTNDS